MKNRRKLLMAALLVLGISLVVGCTAQRCAKLVSAGDNQMAAGDYPSAANRYEKARKVKESDKVRLYTSDPPAVLREVMAYAQAQSLPVTSINTSGPTLEDVFLRLTGRSLSE